MPNPKLETYKNKATGTVYDYTDAAAQASIAAIEEKIPDVASSENQLVTEAGLNNVLNFKEDKVPGKGLSTNDYDNTEKAKVAGAFPRSEQAVLGAKQFYNIDAPALQLSNVTATKSNNGWQIQTSASAAYPFASFPVNIPANTDIRFSCGVAITSGSSVISIDGSNDGSSYTPVKQIFSPAANVNEVFNSGNYKYYRMRLFANFNETASTDGDILYSDILFTLASDTDRTVVPYAMTNKELTERFAKVPFTIPSTTGSVVKLADYPSGFNNSNAVIVNFAIDGRVGIGQFGTTYNRCFVQLASSEIQIFNGESGNVGKTGYLILGKL